MCYGCDDPSVRPPTPRGRIGFESNDRAWPSLTGEPEGSVRVWLCAVWFGVVSIKRFHVFFDDMLIVKDI